MEMEEPTVQNTTANGDLPKEKQYDIHIEPDQRILNKTGFFKQSKSYKMFPVFEKRWRIDDYGEVIDPYVFMNGEFQHAMAQQQALLEEVYILCNYDLAGCKSGKGDQDTIQVLFQSS
jgi:hypothetical protein